MTNQELKDLITGWFNDPAAVKLEFTEEGNQYPQYQHTQGLSA